MVVAHDLLMQTSHKIKKIGLIIWVLCGFIRQAHAQYYNNPEYTELQGGLIAGANFSQVDGDGYKGYDKTGINAGGILFLPFGENVGLPFDATLALSLEVLYEQKGSVGKGAVPNSNGVVAQKIQLHYAEVPVMLNLFRGTRKSGFGMGLAVGYLGFSEETIEPGKLKEGNPFKKLDFSFVLGGNIHIYKGFFLNPRFEYSLLSVRNNNGRYGGRDTQYNNIISLRVMYLVSRRSR